MLDHKKLAAIHIAKNHAGVSDNEYRVILSRYGVTTSRDLSDQAAMALIRELNDRRPIVAGPTVAKIWALWYNEIKPYLPEREQNSFYLLGIVRRATGVNISRPDDFRRLDAREMYKAIEALKLKADELSPIPF